MGKVEQVRALLHIALGIMTEELDDYDYLESKDMDKDLVEAALQEALAAAGE